MLALYHFGPVANSLTPLLCLLEKDIAFEDGFLASQHWEHHLPDYRAVNPQGTVPALVHDGRVVTESTVINEYLEDVFPAVQLRPADPWLRARMRIWTKYVDEVFCPALTVLGAQGAVPFASAIDKHEMQERLAQMPDPEVRKKWTIVSSEGFSQEQLADARAKLANVVARMEEALGADGEWIVGESYTLADIKLYSMTPGVERLLPDVCGERASPSVYRWLRRMEQRPAVQAMLAREYRRQVGPARRHVAPVRQATGS